MQSFRMTAIVAAALAVSGCFKLDVKLPRFGGDEIRDGDGGDGAGETTGESRPSQLPAGDVFLNSDHGAVFYAYDTLAHPKKPVDLAVKLLSARDLRPIQGVTVSIYRGEWVAGRVNTDANGIASLRCIPPAAGNYTFTARIVAVPHESYQELLEVAPAEMLVAARDKETPFVVIDLDHTIVDSSFFRVLLDGGRPMPDSVAAVKRIAEVYSIIYLTHRPDLLTRKSKQFLTRNGYPPGPLLVSELKDVFDSGEFKTAKLSEVRKAFPRVAVGIGDKLSDAQAYVDNGLTAYLIPHYKDKPEDMRKMAGQIRRLRGGERLHVVSGWREVQQGLFDGRSFPPATFATMLETRAARMEAEDRAREERDEDDD
ncbi:MAG: hypothetical protein WBF17_05295 [Phycisphaerae bacterium]